jgi:arginase
MAAHPEAEDRVPTPDHPAPEGEDVYKHIKNAHLIGPALWHTYEEALKILQKGQFLLSVGGDHSISTSTIAAASKVHPDLAVIWVNAHGASNTPEISPSMHYHGMPAAHLMGWFRRHPTGLEWVPDKCIDESRVAMIGLRDVDKKEGKLLRDSDAYIYTMRDVDGLGMKNVIESAIKSVDPNGNRPIHLSLDIDAIDPTFASATGINVRGGLTDREAHYLVEELGLTGRLVSMDLVEMNPGMDSTISRMDHGDLEGMNDCSPTVKLGVELCLSALGKSIMHT